MNIGQELRSMQGEDYGFSFAELEIDADSIRAVMINEVAPAEQDQDFYSSADAAYSKSAAALFQKAGVQIPSARALLDRGIYITNAVKRPKTAAAAAMELMDESLPYLGKELSLFPNLSVIMLMGDVAKKAFNKIAKQKTKKNVIPAGSTYKLRNGIYYYGKIRVLPSYIMTGKNILIEKSKVEMAAEDIALMLQILAD